MYIYNFHDAFSYSRKDGLGMHWYRHCCSSCINRKKGQQNGVADGFPRPRPRPRSYTPTKALAIRVLRPFKHRVLIVSFLLVLEVFQHQNSVNLTKIDNSKVGIAAYAEKANGLRIVSSRPVLEGIMVYCGTSWYSLLGRASFSFAVCPIIKPEGETRPMFDSEAMWH